MLKHIAIALALLASTADAKPRSHKRIAVHDTKWMRECIADRMQNASANGASNGSRSEARAICKAEQPDDDVAKANAQLAIARANAKVSKARERVAKAIEACEQAVVDACIATAADGQSCEDDALKVEFNRQCLAQEGK